MRTKLDDKIDSKALEVAVNGVVIGVFVPPVNTCFAVSLRSGQNDSISACATYPGATENSKWYLPTIQTGQKISFKMIDSPIKANVSSQIILN